MRVKELISKLSEYDPELVVCVKDNDFGYVFECSSLDFRVVEGQYEPEDKRERSKGGELLVLWGLE